MPINTRPNRLFLCYTGYGGAIISMVNTSLSFIGISNFINNSVDNGDGGAIYAEYNVPLNFTGTSNFFNNSAPDGGVEEYI